jgi:hypothetical protein
MAFVWEMPNPTLKALFFLMFGKVYIDSSTHLSHGLKYIHHQTNFT